jgi:hypothetical protein
MPKRRSAGGGRPNISKYKSSKTRSKAKDTATSLRNRYKGARRAVTGTAEGTGRDR